MSQQSSLPKPEGRLIISVKEARKLLGQWSKELPDTEVERIITLLEVIAKGTIQSSSN